MTASARIRAAVFKYPRLLELLDLQRLLPQIEHALRWSDAPLNKAVLANMFMGKVSALEIEPRQVTTNRILEEWISNEYNPDTLKRINEPIRFWLRNGDRTRHHQGSSISHR